jgi:hypothetical protein
MGQCRRWSIRVRLGCGAPMHQRVVLGRRLLARDASRRHGLLRTALIMSRYCCRPTYQAPLSNMRTLTTPRLRQLPASCGGGRCSSPLLQPLQPPPAPAPEHIVRVRLAASHDVAAAIVAEDAVLGVLGLLPEALGCWIAGSLASTRISIYRQMKSAVHFVLKAFSQCHEFGGHYNGDSPRNERGC